MSTNQRARRLRRVRLALLTGLCVAGCGGDEAPARTPSEIQDRDVAQLRSIGYAGSTEAPPDAPTGVVHSDRDRVAPGYRLYTIQELGRAELISADGQAVRRWRCQPGDRWERSVLTANGDLLAIGLEGLGWQPGSPRVDSLEDSRRYVVRLDWHGKLVWKRNLPAHHDIEVTPSGKLLLLAFQRRLEADVHRTVETKSDELTLLDREGDVLESLSLTESIRNARDPFTLEPVEPSTPGGRPWVDLLHTNSVQWMFRSHLFPVDPIYGPDNVLVSMRHQDRVAIIDWRAREVVWSWGLGSISGPHDAEVLENGNILLFDNGQSRGWSRAIELDPLSETIVWEFKATPPESFFTNSRGSAERLPNGNTLLAQSDLGRAIEVTPQGEIVWEFVCPYTLAPGARASIVRMVHHSAEFVEGLGLAPPSQPVTGGAAGKPDSDGDSIPDDIDPLPADPTGTDDFVARDLRNLGVYVVRSSSVAFSARIANGRRQRRSVLGNKLSSAANAVTAGDVEEAVEQLNSLFLKLDGKPEPEDWMEPGTTEKSTVAGRIRRDLVLLGYL